MIMDVILYIYYTQRCNMFICNMYIYIYAHQDIHKYAHILGPAVFFFIQVILIFLGMMVAGLFAACGEARSAFLGAQ